MTGIVLRISPWVSCCRNREKYLEIRDQLMYIEHLPSQLKTQESKKCNFISFSYWIYFLFEYVPLGDKYNLNSGSLSLSFIFDPGDWFSAQAGLEDTSQDLKHWWDYDVLYVTEKILNTYSSLFPNKVLGFSLSPEIITSVLFILSKNCPTFLGRCFVSLVSLLSSRPTSWGHLILLIGHLDIFDFIVGPCRSPQSRPHTQDCLRSEGSLCHIWAIQG